MSEDAAAAFDPLLEQSLEFIFVDTNARSTRICGRRVARRAAAAVKSLLD